MSAITAVVYLRLVPRIIGRDTNSFLQELLPYLESFRKSHNFTLITSSINSLLITWDPFLLFKG